MDNASPDSSSDLPRQPALVAGIAADTAQVILEELRAVRADLAALRRERPGSEPMLLTVTQLATISGFTPKAIRQRHARGEVPGAVHVGRSLRFRRREVLTWLRQGRVPLPEGDGQ